MGEVIDLDIETTAHIPPDKVLSGAIGKLKDVVVIGKNENDEWYFASSQSDIANIVYFCEAMKYELMAQCEDAY